MSTTTRKLVIDPNRREPMVDAEARHRQLATNRHCERIDQGIWRKRIHRDALLRPT
ncbi:hypothetical protein [Algiphilus sp.]|uniref:hypothetical protein n=1 Tax=Algiphilus sp. TaxID=1872431 RepID=UPI002A612775|nr:hypothetical protein [Pseudomonadota bacterium]